MQVLFYSVFGFITFLCLRFYIKFATNFNIVDYPSQRRDHIGIIARGGGIIVLYSAILGYILYRICFYNFIEQQQLFLLLICLAVSTIFFIEDVKSLPIFIRLTTQSIAIALGIYLLRKNIADDILVFLPFWIKASGIFIGWLWYINLYNFMDGIDGITAMQTSSICAYILIILTFADSYNLYYKQQISEKPFFIDSEIVIDISDDIKPNKIINKTYQPDSLIHYKPFIIILLIATLVFFYFNKTPARVFIGDSGSIGLGFILGALLIKTGCEYSILAAFSCTFYYIFDSTITVLWRFFDGEKIWTPHFRHFIQKAKKFGFSGLQISGIILVINIVLSVLGYAILVFLANKILVFLLIMIEIFLTAGLIIFFQKPQIFFDRS